MSNTKGRFPYTREMFGLSLSYGRSCGRGLRGWVQGLRLRAESFGLHLWRARSALQGSDHAGWTHQTTSPPAPRGLTRASTERVSVWLKMRPSSGNTTALEDSPNQTLMSTPTKPAMFTKCHGFVAIPDWAGTVNAALLLLHDPSDKHGSLVEETSAEHQRFYIRR